MMLTDNASWCVRERKNESEIEKAKEKDQMSDRMNKWEFEIRKE